MFMTAPPVEQLAVKIFSCYETHNSTTPSNYLTKAELLDRLKNPTTGAKNTANLITPFYGAGKTRNIAEVSKFYALAVDHDHDNKTEQQIKALYDSYGFAYMAFTTASHLQPDKDTGVSEQRWKVIIPLAKALPFDAYATLARGVTLQLKTDEVQSRITQGFYAPNKLTADAPYSFIDALARPELDPLESSHPFISASQAAYEIEQQQKQQQAAKAPAKLKAVDFTGTNSSIIEKVCNTYDLASELIKRGHKAKSTSLLISPTSQSGVAGVRILTGDDGKQRCFSHHGETDPLSNLNHDGKALDVFDVICLLDYAGDEAKAIADFAQKLDGENNKERQKEHAKDKAQADALAMLADLHTSEAGELPEPLPPVEIDLLNPPSTAGLICKYLQLKARRLSPELYPLTALHLMALVGRKRQSVVADRLSLITLGIAPSAAGKELAQEEIKVLAKTQYCSAFIFGDAGSFKDLILNQLDGHGSALYVVDEIHSFFGSMSSKNAQSYETKMEAEILKLSTSSLYAFRGMEKRELSETLNKQIASLEKKIDELTGTDAESYTEKEKLSKHLEKVKERKDWLINGMPNPFFSLMGHSVPERLDSFINIDNISSGLIGRALVVRCPENRAKLRRVDVNQREINKLELQIIKDLERIRQDSTKVEINTDAQQYINDCIDWYDDDEQRNHHLLGAIYARAGEHLGKVASILALDFGVITLRHAQYAHALVKASLDDVRYILDVAYSESIEAKEMPLLQAARKKVHKNCKGSGLRLSEIERLVTKPKGWQAMQDKDMSKNYFDDLINKMIETGELIIKQDGRKVRYISQSTAYR